MSSLKKLAEWYNMYTAWKESVCFFIFLTSDSLLGVVNFCRYVHRHMSVCGLVTKFIIAKFIRKKIDIYVTKFIQNKLLTLRFLYKVKSICNLFLDKTFIHNFFINDNFTHNKVDINKFYMYKVYM